MKEQVGGFLPGSLLSAKATMWMPFKSSSCGRKESKVTLPGERYSGSSGGQTQRLEQKWKAGEVVTWERTHRGRMLMRRILMSAGRNVGHLINGFVRQEEDTHCTHDISTEWVSLLWSDGSRRAAVKGKTRKNVSLADQEL